MPEVDWDEVQRRATEHRFADEPESIADDNDWRRLARTDDREPYRPRWGRDVA